MNKQRVHLTIILLSIFIILFSPLSFAQSSKNLSYTRQGDDLVVKIEADLPDNSEVFFDCSKTGLKDNDRAIGSQSPKVKLRNKVAVGRINIMGLPIGRYEIQAIQSYVGIIPANESYFNMTFEDVKKHAAKRNIELAEIAKKREESEKIEREKRRIYSEATITLALNEYANDTMREVAWKYRLVKLNKIEKVSNTECNAYGVMEMMPALSDIKYLYSKFKFEAKIYLRPHEGWTVGGVNKLR